MASSEKSEVPALRPEPDNDKDVPSSIPEPKEAGVSTPAVNPAKADAKGDKATPFRAVPMATTVRTSSDSEEDWDDMGYHHSHHPPPPPPPPGLGHHVPKVGKEVKRGSKAEVKQLFQGEKKCNCCTNWVDKPPQGASKELVTKARWGQYAVVVRKTSHGSDHSWKLHSVTINSQEILKVLRKVLGKYPGLALEGEEVQFTPNFSALVHFWPEIIRSGENSDDPLTREHMDIFRKTLEPELQPIMQKLKDCQQHGKIEFDYLWTLFKPGTLVYWDKDSHGNIARVKQTDTHYTQFGGGTFSLRLEQVDFDGKRFGFKDVTQNIRMYEGHESIFEHVVPLSMRPDAEALKRSLIERGRHFESLHGYHFKAYNGTASNHHASFWGTKNKNLTGRVIIDATKYYEGVPPPSLSPLKVVDPKVPMNPNQPMVHDPYGFNNGYVSPPPMHVDDYAPMPHRGPRGRHMAPPPPPNPFAVPVPLDPENLDEIKPLTEDELMLCVSYVPGFLLKNKYWEMLNVANVTDIQWEDTFNNLVLPNESKDLLLAFAKSKTRGDALFDDFVGGKGKGIIMLLSGPPGVGKTLTAEAIAEKLQVPLYTLSAGELGIVPSMVETALMNSMSNCTRWNSVLLLDECDVFLEKREVNSLKRNELVSIFLRLVEYYEGIMLLTTNRIATIDPAFNSRVDVAIAYDELNTDLRLHIWVNFIEKLRKDGGVIDKTLDTWALRSLAEHELNGRQIKSLVKTAQLLAKSKDQPLSIDHLDAVVSLNKLRDGRAYAS